MHKSIFSEFFYLCAAILFSAVICIAAVLLVLSANFYKSDKRSYLDELMSEAMRKIIFEINTAETINTETLEQLCIETAGDTEIIFTLVDSDGAALACSEAALCSHKKKSVYQETIARISENGLYELSTLDNYYDTDYFNIAYELKLNDNKYFLFGRLPCTSFNNFMIRLALMLAAVTAVIITIVFLVMYLATQNILSPIHEMTIKARQFGEGDFSNKIYVAEGNELGFLAGTLNEMASSLEQIEETRKTFISNVSHELKTPMTTIGGFIDGILDGTIPPEKQEHYLRIVSSEVTRLSRLVRTMLNISKYEAGELTINSEDIDIVSVILPILLNFEKRIEEKNVDIRGLDTGKFIISADRDLIQQVIYNLTENAVKFVNEGGYIEFFFEAQEDYLSFRIRNSGEGLTVNEISKIFDRFYKTDKSRGMDPTGVGLGLSIVSTLVKLQGGKILVSSEPKQYTEFDVQLPKP
ncbi:MAG: HAMP domain-containing histidine kinase [Oscillospiraceae bacterium]|nr:HAMP domain-containing histidine kinase [Oscillospiraceae bacterium]